MLNNTDLYKEFFVKEIDHIKRTNFIEAPFSLGFFFEVGHKALKRRAIFNEFFEGNNLKARTPDLRKIVIKHVEKLKAKYRNCQNLDKDGFMKYEFRDFTPDLFSDIVVQILFGDKEQPIVDGHSLPEVIEENMRKTIEIWKHPVNLLSGGLMEKLSPQLSEIKRSSEKVKEAIRKVIRSRLNHKDEELGVTLVD